MMRFSQGSPYPTHIWRIGTMGIPTGLLLQLSVQATSEFPCFLFFFFFYPSPPHKLSCLIEQLAHMHTAFSAAINHIPGVLGHSNDA